MADIARACLRENSIDDCMLNEAADKLFAEATCLGDLFERDFAIERNIFGDVVVPDKAE